MEKMQHTTNLMLFVDWQKVQNINPKLEQIRSQLAQ
jgi:hypothetical protein